ncbi:MAG: hypothetical protein ACK4ND_11645 [Cytophagaceae bacterium]
MKNASKKTRRLSHIKNLLMVALADGPLNRLEEAFIKARAGSLNLSKKEIEEVLSNPNDIKSCAPLKLGNKILQMYDMIHMMLMDNVMHKNELDTCKEIAAGMNLMEDVVYNIARDVIKSKNAAGQLVLINGNQETRFFYNQLRRSIKN